ncbi:unnamed protein product [Rotaria sp. Silwood2]|nr:unnamed protein product [Rotaria sp. Silwood2]CAF2641611.1 unnamed protein product [Rotaria sp. Silwood2]CAF2916142.1 unnamed protein product [Rotaria sp. Silwood2]CAF3050446.1 unnamed protein product [Rotaria sp. Silwood2]CAF3854607.1 unnamed protein product [Rotaria sp. Silwood2]
MNGFVFDLYNGLTDAGTRIIMLPIKNGTNEDPSKQLWFFNSDGTIENMAAGKVIDISSGIGGTDLIIWSKTGGANQQWVVNGTCIYCPVAGKAIDIPGRNTTAGAALIVWSPNGSVNQQWYLVPKFL